MKHRIIIKHKNNNMTKEEYKRQASRDYINALLNADKGVPSCERVFEAGFEAGCEYYRKHILELS